MWILYFSYCQDHQHCPWKYCPNFDILDCTLSNTASRYKTIILKISAPTSLIQTVARTKSASWAIPLVFSYQAIFIKNPTSVYNYAAYLEPMAYLSWVIIVVFLIFTPPFLYLVSTYDIICLCNVKKG